MNTKNRIQLLHKIAQASKALPLSENLGGYKERLNQLIPSIHLPLFDPASWNHVATILGIIDWSLSELSKNTLNFKSVFQSPTLDSAKYENHDELTALIRLANHVIKCCSLNRVQYTKEEKKQVIDGIEAFISGSSISSTNPKLQSVIGGNAKDSLLKELRLWSSSII